ncbi:MAG: acetyl-CoA carboxylase carboxyltransferase subunit alpha [Rhodothalassiaceae bacterium]
MTFLDFEKPIADLENKIRELKELADNSDEVDFSEELQKLETKLDRLLHETYAKLTPWQKTQVARHPDRPHFRDVVAHLFTDFEPLAGDRRFGEDHAIQGGPARFKGEPVMIIGHEKGCEVASRIKHNFGMALPEGYRKAQRLMDMADRFSLPVMTFIDTPGAYPGINAEERGQAEAIAQCTGACLRLKAPLIATIMGEGGSGGAVALAAANRVIMLEHSVYSVISPEGCASILWRTADKAQEAAAALKITAQDLEEHQIIDRIVPEPVGGAHRDWPALFATLSEALASAMTELSLLDGAKLAQLRQEKFLKIGRLDAA